MRKFTGWILLILLLLGIDQAMKIWVKTHMVEGQQISVIGDWFYLYFVENPGAAFGLFIDRTWFKPALSIARVLIIIFLVIFFIRFIKYNTAPTVVKICFSLIMAGAIGNIIDSIFYGLLFTESFSGIAELFPSQGYAPLLYGRVVDMFYFPIIKTTLPSWVPFWGGEYFEFFRPIFNFSDSYITISIFMLFIFYRKWFKNFNYRIVKT